MNYFTSDLHFGHLSITKYRTNFLSQEEHDNYFLDEIAKLKKRDILYVLGDFIFDSDKYDWYLEQLNKMPCRIKLVLGNHDSLKLYNEDRFELQLPLFTYKNFWISHCPIHEQELRGRLGCVHGHLHYKRVIRDEYDFSMDYWSEEIDNRYFNVCPEVNEFKFVEFDKIKEEMR